METIHFFPVLFYFLALSYNRHRCPALLQTAHQLLLIIKSHYSLILSLHFCLIYYQCRDERSIATPLKSDRDGDNNRLRCLYFTCVCFSFQPFMDNSCICLSHLLICVFPSTFSKSTNPEEPTLRRRWFTAFFHWANFKPPRFSSRSPFPLDNTEAWCIVGGGNLIPGAGAPSCRQAPDPVVWLAKFILIKWQPYHHAARPRNPSSSLWAQHMQMCSAWAAKHTCDTHRVHVAHSALPPPDFIHRLSPPPASQTHTHTLTWTHTNTLTCTQTHIQEHPRSMSLIRGRTQKIIQLVCVHVWMLLPNGGRFTNGRQMNAL